METDKTDFGACRKENLALILTRRTYGYKGAPTLTWESGADINPHQEEEVCFREEGDLSGADVLLGDMNA